MAIINYYKRMKSGLYNVEIDRMALYDKNNPAGYVYSTTISNTGELVVQDPDTSEIIETGLSILGMIAVFKKGYPISIRKVSNIKEIIETIYNHISACIEVKRNSIYQEFTVDVDELVDMEEFMLDIMEANPETVKELFKEELIRDMKNSGLVSIFSDDTIVEVRENDMSKYRRVSASKDIDFSVSDLLNTL